MTAQRFTVTARPGPRGSIFVPVPFDPDVVWTPKPKHHVSGNINGMRIRAVIDDQYGDWGFVLGPAALAGCGVAPDAELTVTVEPEGPQRVDLAEDIAAALDADPSAAAFFDSLAQFYRKAYLSWVEATKRSPQLRADRLAEMIELLRAGVKERPRH